MLRELRSRAHDLPEEVSAVLNDLAGEDGLLERRNRFIHAIWRGSDSGLLTGMNIRSVAEAVRSGALDEGLEIGQIEESSEALSCIAETLGEWMARKFGIDT